MGSIYLIFFPFDSMHFSFLGKGGKEDEKYWYELPWTRGNTTADVRQRRGCLGEEEMYKNRLPKIGK